MLQLYLASWKTSDYIKFRGFLKFYYVPVVRKIKFGNFKGTGSIREFWLCSVPVCIVFGKESGECRKRVTETWMDELIF